MRCLPTFQPGPTWNPCDFPGGYPWNISQIRQTSMAMALQPEFSRKIPWDPMDPNGSWNPCCVSHPASCQLWIRCSCWKSPPKKNFTLYHLISSYISYISYIYIIYISYISYIPLFFGLDSTKFDLSGGGNFDVQLSIHLAVRDHALIEKLLPNRTGCFSWLNKMGIQMGFIMVEAHD